MKANRVLVGFTSVLSLAVLLGSCGDSQPSAPTTVIATPTPAPSATATPALAKPPVRVVLSLFGYTRKEGSNQGRFQIPPPPPTFQQADSIDIECNPRDEDGRITGNHPPFVEWYSSSGGDGVLIDRYDYVWNEGDRWSDQIEIRYLSRSGYIDVYCRIPGTEIRSNTLRINVFGGIR